MSDTLTTNEAEIKQEALTIVEQTKVIKIIDQPTYDAAASLLLDKIKPFRKRWQQYWDDVKKPAWAAYQAIQSKFNEGDKPLEAAEIAVKQEIRRWEAEQERVRQELQRKAEADAREREEEERLQAATLAEEAGATEDEVQEVLNAPTMSVAPPVEPTYQKAVGVSSRENWKAKVTDMKKLCAAIAKGQAPVTYVLANESALNARAKADKQTLNIPGVVAYNESVISGRSR